MKLTLLYSKININTFPLFILMSIMLDLLIFFAGLFIITCCFARMCHEEGMDDDDFNDIV